VLDVKDAKHALKRCHTSWNLFWNYTLIPFKFVPCNTLQHTYRSVELAKHRRNNSMDRHDCHVNLIFFFLRVEMNYTTNVNVSIDVHRYCYCQIYQSIIVKTCVLRKYKHMYTCCKQQGMEAKKVMYV